MGENVFAKQRIIQEFVPGKQVTLAHVIANPDAILYQKIGLTKDHRGAIGIFTITPGEGAIIAADIATKASEVQLAFVDRFSGAVAITGVLASVEASLRSVVETLETVLGFTPTQITRT